MEEKLTQREPDPELEMPEGKSRYKFPQEALHFVNMSYPLSDNSKPSKGSIHSHVARVAHQKVRRRRLIQFLQSKNARSGDQQNRDNEDPAIRRETTLSSTVNSGQVWPLSSSIITQPHAGPVNLLTSGTRDPFQSYPIWLTPHEQFLLDHFVNYVIPHWALFYPRSKTEPEYQQGMMLHWLPLALTEPGIMYGVLFAACRSLALLHLNRSHLHDSFKYNDTFIQSIKKDILKDQGSVQDSTILKESAAIILTVSHTGNVQGTTSHVKAIGAMVKRKGGLQNLELGGFLKQLVLWQDRTIISYLEASPTFSHTITFEENASIEHLSIGFRQQAVLHQIGVDMVNLLSDICAYTKHLEQVPLPWSYRTRQILSSQVGDFEARLLILGSNYNNPLSFHVHSLVEECVFLALRVFLQMMPHQSSLPPMGCKLLAARMNSVLSKVILLPSWDEFADLILWVVFMASIVSGAGVKKEQELPGFFAGLRKQVDVPLQFDEISGDDETYWISKLKGLLPLLGASSNDGIKLHLKRFLWVDSLCDIHSLDIWRELEAVQTHLGSS